MKAKILNQTAQHKYKLCKLWERKSLVLVLLFIMNGITLKTFAQADKELQKLDKQFFIENKGQWPSEVLFMTKRGGLNAWITKNGMVYDFYKFKEVAKKVEDKNEMHTEKKDEPKEQYGQIVRMTLEGANIASEPKGNEKGGGYFNYLIGNDKSKWATEVAQYKEVVIKNTYTNIDTKYYFDEGSIRYDYMIQPGASPTDIKIKLEGVNSTKINEAGELVFTTRFGDVKQAKLYTYQMIEGEKVTVDCKFKKLANGNISFDAGAYDKKKPLVVDPLIYSTFIGGMDKDFSSSIALDINNNTYIAGTTYSANFPTTPGAYDQTLDGLTDGFICKFDLTLCGSASLIYSTFIGGTTKEELNAIDVDPTTGIVYVTGGSTSLDYPTTTAQLTPYQANNNYCGNNGSLAFYDVVVSILSASGANLLYSTYIGGCEHDRAFGIKIDPTIPVNPLNYKSAYITGFTYSAGAYPTGYPITPLAYNTIHNGDYDVFVSKINPNIGPSGLDYSTFLGGNGWEIGRGIDIDANGNVIIVGSTNSNGFGGPGFGLQDVFVTKFNPTLSTTAFTKRLGGNSVDYGLSLITDVVNKDIYITGQAGDNFPVDIPGSFGGGPGDVFVTRLRESDGSIINSRYIGGVQHDEGNSIKLFGNGVYIFGLSNSNNYPTTTCAYDPTYNPDESTVLTKLSSDLSTIIYSTYLGSIYTQVLGPPNSYVSPLTGMAIDNFGYIYMTGFSGNSIFPTTNCALSTTGNADGFLTKLDILNDEYCCSVASGVIANAATTILLDNIDASTAISLGLLNLTNNAQTYFINGVFNVNVTGMVFNNCTFYFTANSSIKLGIGTNMTCVSCIMQSPDCEMWKGIDVTSTNAKLILNSTSPLSPCIIKNMHTGIEVSNTGILFADNCHFYDNYCSIIFSNLPNGYTGYIYSSEFKTVSPLLLAPYATYTRGETGIKILNCKNITIGSSSQPTLRNHFENLFNGIYIRNSLTGSATNTITTSYNTFKNIKEGQTLWPPNLGLSINTDPRGCAIFGVNGVPIYNCRLEHSGLYNPNVLDFEDCQKAIVLNAMETSLYGTNMENTDAGLLLYSNQYKHNAIHDNHINNTYMGMQITGYTTGGAYDNFITDVHAHFTPSPYGGSTFWGKGIEWYCYMPTPSIYAGFPITGNTITSNERDYVVGVNVSNSPFCPAKNNHVNFTSTSTSPITYPYPALVGLAFNNSQRSAITDNTILGTNNSPAQDVRKSCGIYMRKSPNNYLACNINDYLQYGMYIIGDCEGYKNTAKDNQGVENNRVTTTKFGWLFRHLTTNGTFGDLGKPNLFDNNNIFYDIAGSNNMRVYKVTNTTLCNSNPINSRIFTKVSTLNQNQSTCILSCRYDIVANNSTLHQCNPIINMIPPGVSTIDDLQEALDIANNDIPYAEFANVGDWMDERVLDDELENDPSTRNAYPVLDSFYLSRQGTVLARLNEIDRDILHLVDSIVVIDSNLFLAKWNIANNLNTSITSTVYFEQNEIWINNLYLKVLKYGNESLTQSEIDDINTLAFQCPYVAGNAVFKARMLNAMYYPGAYYEDLEICNNIGVYKNGKGLFDEENNVINHRVSDLTVLNNENIKLYPNPASENVTLQYQLANNENGILILFDILGREVKRILLSNKKETVMINVHDLQQGVYTYQYVVNDIQRSTGKLIIAK